MGEAEGAAAGEEKEEGSCASTHIGMDGVMQFFEDLKVELDDVRCLLVAWYFHAKAMGEFTKTEFTLGMARLKCVSMDQLVARLPSLQFEVEVSKLKFSVKVSGLSVLTNSILSVNISLH